MYQKRILHDENAISTLFLFFFPTKMKKRVLKTWVDKKKIHLLELFKLKHGCPIPSDVRGYAISRGWTEKRKKYCKIEHTMTKKRWNKTQIRKQKRKKINNKKRQRKRKRKQIGGMTIRLTAGAWKRLPMEIDTRASTASTSGRDAAPTTGRTVTATRATGRCDPLAPPFPLRRPPPHPPLPFFLSFFSFFPSERNESPPTF